MVYVKDSKFIAVVTHNGKILRDFKNEEDNFQVKLPFGEEYGLRFKNMNTTRVAVSVYVDGEDALDGSRIVVEPNESHDLEGFMKGNTVKNKFKFIEKTDKIKEHRGENIDDGMIRIEYQFEKKPANIEKTVIKEIEKIREVEKPWRSLPLKPYDPWYPNPYKPHITWSDEQWTTSNSNKDDSVEDDSVEPSQTSKGIMRGLNDSPRARRLSIDADGNVTPPAFSAQNATFGMSAASTPEPENEDGITVKGSQVNINYKNVFLKEMEEQKHVMVLSITGYKEDKKKGKIVEAVTTKQKIECETCGNKNKSSSKFCSDCGTSLV